MIDDFIALWERLRAIEKPTRDDLVEHLAAEMRIGVPDHEPFVHYATNELGYSLTEISEMAADAKTRK